MTQLVGISHDVDRLDEVAFDLEGVRLNQAGRPAHNQPGQAVDRVEAHRDVVNQSFADDARHKSRDAIGAFDDIEGCRGYRTRWSAIQTGFVDEPRKAVEEADALVAEVMKRLAEIFADERGQLESQWERADQISTEDLRLAMRRYRSFFERLLSV
jgi:hypothetical protein